MAIDERAGIRMPRAFFIPRASSRSLGYAVGGIVFLLLVWEALALFAFHGSGAIPTPASVVAEFVRDLADARYWNGIGVTAWEAARGFFWGNLIALAVTAVVFLIPWLEGVSTQLAVITSCIPLTAIAPLIVLMSPQSSRLACVVLAGLSVFFTTVVGSLAGLRAADAASVDLVHAYGGGKWKELTKVRLVAALPHIMSALVIAAPAAFVGAILGELFLSGVDSGLGIMLMAAQIAVKPQQLWALALLCAAVAGVAYAVMSLLARVATPWYAQASGGSGVVATTYRRPLRHFVVTIVALLGSAAFLLVLWQLMVLVLPLNPYIARSPLQVLQYVTQDPTFGNTTAAAIRHRLIGLTVTTLRDAGIGFAVGVAASILLALIFFLLPRAQSAFMPLAMLMRTIPLVGFAPIIYLIFGNGALTIGLIGAIIVFFPVLINMNFGLRSATAQTLDVVSVYGGSRLTALRKVAIPSALPQLFASIKISVPGSLVAAMLYEWLFSLQGLGGDITVANAHSLYGETWAIVIAVTGISIIAYNIVELIEVPVLALWGPQAGRHD
jgi:ABC-type nitrate/sulfonate/bicarbonate transport system permease component